MRASVFPESKPSRADEDALATKGPARNEGQGRMMTVTTLAPLSIPSWRRWRLELPLDLVPPTFSLQF